MADSATRMHPHSITIDKARELTSSLPEDTSNAPWDERMPLRSGRAVRAGLLGILLAFSLASAHMHAASAAARAGSAIASSPAPGTAGTRPVTSGWPALQAQLEAKVRAAYPAAASITITAPDAAQRLVPTCASALQVDPQGPRLFGNLSVRVACANAEGGSAGHAAAARLPVVIRVAVPMLVARTAIPRGAIVDASMVALEPTAIGAVSDYLVDVHGVLGQRMRTGVRAGQVLTLRQVEMGALVTAGEQVALVAGDGEFSVSVAAKAMQSGRAGEQIRVRNIASGRVVPAWVVGRGTTRTRPPDPAADGPGVPAAPIAKE